MRNTDPARHQRRALEVTDLATALRLGAERGLGPQKIIRRRISHGDWLTDCGLHGSGRRAERRLREIQWTLWSRIMRDAKANARGPENPWLPCPVSMRWYFLEIVPPRYFTGGFAVGEADHHDAQGRAVYLCFRGIPGTSRGFQCRYSTLEAERAGAAA